MTAAFRCTLRELSAASDDEILGRLTSAASDSGFAIHYHKQTEAWQEEIRFARRFASECTDRVADAAHWTALFEFEIPRRGKRPDIVLLADDVIFVLEFKFGSKDFSGGGDWQVVSYGLDLRDFHFGSAGRIICPILIATLADSKLLAQSATASGSLVRPITKLGDANGEMTAAHVCEQYKCLHRSGAEQIDAVAWEESAYRPTPTIIEAAQSLFSGHSVAEISHAFATNLDETSAELIRAIERAHSCGERVICFVTGLPGAGKTLAGLNAVHNPSLRASGRPAGVFLSGNGPLVKIVREALTRDQQRAGHNRQAAARLVSTFIGNVHRFIKDYGLQDTSKAPYENAIVFDEAQRAWDGKQVLAEHGAEWSEPSLVLDIMERAPEWCAVVALVGGGQEINRGEAGLEEWGRALNARNTPWRVVASPEVLSGGEAVAGHKLFEASKNHLLSLDPIAALHLKASVRSPRDRMLGVWVNDLLFPSEFTNAAAHEPRSNEYPIVLTRQLDVAREWLRERSDGLQRAGLLASSGALRLRYHGIEVTSGFRKGYSYADWFLGSPDDSRSSSFLEVAATEFECQGLEVDWSGICWGGDAVISPNDRSWKCRKFRGTKWQNVRDPVQIRYTLNKYRVLLTRARKGMVIWVPKGDLNDPTRDPELFDATADYLVSCGIEPL